MGSWGPGPFENDAAADWLDDLADLTGTEIVRNVATTIDAAIDDPGDGDTAAVAVAASAVVASSRDHGAEGMAEEIATVIATVEAQLGDLTPRAIAALRSIRSTGELRDLWEASGASSEWLAVLSSLERRLSGKPG